MSLLQVVVVVVVVVVVAAAFHYVFSRSIRRRDLAGFERWALLLRLMEIVVLALVAMMSVNCLFR